MHDAPPDPFALDHPPVSPGRVLLARAFAHWCIVHHGLSPAEVADALRDAPGCEALVRESVAGEAHLLGSLLASGRLASWSRPVGGGPSSALPRETWEVDDFRPILSTGAICPVRPFDAAARRTHWVFVDADEFDELVELSCADVLRGFSPSRARRAAARGGETDPGDAPLVGRAAEERHVRLPEVKARTGMSRSTIYARMREGRFPATVPMTGNIAAWRESEVAEWLADPR